MKNKINLKSIILVSVVIIVVFNISFGILSYYQYKIYTNNFNKKIDMIITKITNVYPDVNKNDIIEILNNDSYDTQNLLENYGIDLNKDSVVLENNKYFTYFLILNLILLTFVLNIILVIFLVYNRYNNKSLREITRYIKEINNRNYNLKIDDNSEGELSILKNEIYKTTVMLNEIATNSINDKISLKNSLSDISHQLKTPLTSITIMLDNILDNDTMPNDTRNGFIKDVKRQIVNINFLIESLLKLSKFDAHTIKFTTKEESVYEVLNESIKNVEMLCDLKDIKINLNVDYDFKLKCDPKWQVEAITNILKNCIEHSTKGKNITINCSKNKIYTMVEIKDEGTGIDKEDLPHIFERFYKGKNSSNDSVGIRTCSCKINYRDG